MIVNLDWYRRFLVIFVCAIFYTSVADYTERFGFNPLKWMMILTALTAPLLLHAIFENRYRVQPLILWGLGYLIITIVWYIPAVQDASAFRQVRLRFLSVIFLFLMLLILNRPAEQRLARQWIAAGVVLGTALNIYEQFHPMTFSPTPGRSMGLYPNIGQSGGALVLGLIISRPALPKRLQTPFAMIAAVGVVTTFARASILGWILVMAFWTVRNGVNPRQVARGLVMLALLFGFFTSSYWQGIQTTLEHRGAFNADVIQRLQFFDKANTDDGSSEERKAIAEYSLRLVKEKPLLGRGTGAITGRNLENYTVGPHNMYLALMIDHGVVGLFILPMLVAAMMWGCRRTQFDTAAPLSLFILLWGFFNHNVLEERYLLLVVALSGAMIVSDRIAAKESPAAAAPAPRAARSIGAFA